MHRYEELIKRESFSRLCFNFNMFRGSLGTLDRDSVNVIDESLRALAASRTLIHEPTNPNPKGELTVRRHHRCKVNRSQGLKIHTYENYYVNHKIRLHSYYAAAIAKGHRDA